MTALAPRPRAAALALAAGAALACATGAGAGPSTLLRVDAPGSPAGAEADAQELRIARGVREVGRDERLVCVPAGGALVLVCSPADVGTRTAQVRVTLRRAGRGYEVDAEGPFVRKGDPALCSLQRRLARAIDAEVGFPAARLHGGSGCQ